MSTSIYALDVKEQEIKKFGQNTNVMNVNTISTDKINIQVNVYYVMIQGKLEHFKENYVNVVTEPEKNYTHSTSDKSTQTHQQNQTIITQPKPKPSLFKKDYYYISLAFDIASKSSLNFQHGSIIVYKNNIISSGYNTISKTIKTKKTYQKMASCHAEMMAVNNAFEKLGNKIYGKNLCLYVTRKTNSGKFGESSPCLHCTQLMSDYNINTVVYTTTSGDINKIKLKDYVPKKAARVKKSIVINGKERFTWSGGKKYITKQ